MVCSKSSFRTLINPVIPLHSHQASATGSDTTRHKLVDLDWRTHHVLPCQILGGHALKKSKFMNVYFTQHCLYYFSAEIPLGLLKCWENYLFRE